MWPGGHCTLFTAGIGAASAGIIAKSIATVTTSFIIVARFHLPASAVACWANRCLLAPQGEHSMGTLVNFYVVSKQSAPL
jgi:hypothetical protein